MSNPVRRTWKWPKVLCQINQETLKARKRIVTVRKLFSQCVHSWWRFAEGVLQVVLCTILWFRWSVKKHCVAKVLLATWQIFFHKNNRDYSSYIFGYKFAFIFFLSFLTIEKQGSGFQQVSCLVTRNISVFCL